MKNRYDVLQQLSKYNPLYENTLCQLKKQFENEGDNDALLGLDNYKLDKGNMIDYASILLVSELYKGNKKKFYIIDMDHYLYSSFKLKELYSKMAEVQFRDIAEELQKLKNLLEHYDESFWDILHYLSYYFENTPKPKDDLLTEFLKYKKKAIKTEAEWLGGKGLLNSPYYSNKEEYIFYQSLKVKGLLCLKGDFDADEVFELLKEEEGYQPKQLPGLVEYISSLHQSNIIQNVINNCQADNKCMEYTSPKILAESQVRILNIFGDVSTEACHEFIIQYYALNAVLLNEKNSIEKAKKILRKYNISNYQKVDEYYTHFRKEAVHRDNCS